ncbi:MAG TPA: hypothetical protein VHO47_05260 [Candidatus Babeliales bacterium]|nr:hypothetical protein [Candidatus Babeliales bacterium]
MNGAITANKINAAFGMSAVVFLSCILWFASPEKDQHFDLDSYGYERIAINFAQNHQLKDPDHADIPVQVIGYPLFMGVIYAIFGAHYQLIILLQILLTLAICFLIWSAAVQLFCMLAGRIAFLLSCINIGFLVFAQFILTETIATFLLILFFERLIVFLKNGSYRSLVISSSAFGLCLIIKPTPLFFIPIFMILLKLLPNYARINRSYFGMINFYIWIPMALLLAYNYYTYGVAQIAPTMQENIYYYFLAKLKSADQHITIEQAYQEIDATFGHYKRTSNKRWAAAQQEFFGFVRKKPFLIMRLWCESMLKTVGGLFTSQLKLLLNQQLKGTPTSLSSADGSGIEKLNNYIRRGAPNGIVILIGWAEFIFNLIRYGLIIAGLMVLVRKRAYWLALFFLAFCGYFIFVTGHDGCARYRLVIEPMLTIFASFGILVLYKLFNKSAYDQQVLSNLWIAQ